MKKIKPFVLLAGITCLLLLMSCEIRSTKNAPSVQKPIGNPASQNCLTKGGRLVIKKNPSGSEYGICYFVDNNACEEWALLDGHCPVGGRGMAWFENEAQRYCAITWGEVHMGDGKQPDTCNLGDTSGTCNTEDYFIYGKGCSKK